MSGSVKLSRFTTVDGYRELERTNNRQAAGDFLVERFEERYFRPVEDSSSKHGFAIIAVACLVIETLESFYQGLPDTRRCSKKIFRDFLGRETPLNVLADGDQNWFYERIRCGVLHQGESLGGWRILRSGPLVDYQAKKINATFILRVLRVEVRSYAKKLRTDDVIWEKFMRKMQAICDNCRESP